jgi:hypothetical protein
MPGSKAATARQRTPVKRSGQAAPAPASPHAVVVADVRRLQAAAWAQFHTARKRLEKATRDLHRHEEVDSPAYESWLHRTFPLLVTTLRELQEDAVAKARKIQMVQAKAYVSGRSVKRLWREEKERERNPDLFPEDGGDENGESRRPGDEDDEVESTVDRKPSPARSRTARDIYRRLVQRLHPDHGGKWTPDRQRLWHEVQQAWAAGDTDWLSRLEVDWETAHEVLGPASPLSRLYRAIEELDAGRRDTERKLHAYRSAPAWRFTLTEKKRDVLHARIEGKLHVEIATLKRHVRHLDSLIAAWEDDWTRSDHRGRAGRRRSTRY